MKKQRECHAKMEAEKEEMCLQNKKRQRLLRTTRNQEKGMEQILPLNPQRRTNPADTIILVF